MPKKKANVASAADSSPPAGGSPSGEVPVVDEEALRRRIREEEIKEAALKSTAEEGTTRYAYEAGDTVHGRVDATGLQQEEELKEIPQKARSIRGTSFSTDCFTAWIRQGTKCTLPTGTHWSRRHRSTA